MGMKDSIGTVAKLLVQVRDANLQAQLQEALLNAQGEALDLQEQVAQLQEENAQLKHELKVREEASEVAEQLFYARNAYWRKDEDLLSAYCSACWDTKRQLVRLARQYAPGTPYGGDCPSCHATYARIYAGVTRPNPTDKQ